MFARHSAKYSAFALFKSAMYLPLPTTLQSNNFLYVLFSCKGKDTSQYCIVYFRLCMYTGCFWKYWHICFRFLRDLMYVKAHVRCTRRKRDLWKFVWQHACFHPSGGITVRRKKRRHCNFTFKQNPAFLRKGVSGAVLNMKPCFPGTLLFTLLRNTP